jgi:hypothetical protein
LRSGRIGAKKLDLGLNPVSHFTHPQGACEAGTALERMQRTQHFHARALVVGTRGPLPQRTTQLRHEFGGLFLKDREEIGVNGIDRIDFVVFAVVELRSDMGTATGVTNRTGGATTATGGGTGVARTGAGASGTSALMTSGSG